MSKLTTPNPHPLDTDAHDTWERELRAELTERDAERGDVTTPTGSENTCGIGAPRFLPCTLPVHAGSSHEHDDPANGQHYSFTLATCAQCGCELEHMGRQIGWVDVEEGSTYDICRESRELDGPHVVA